MLANRHGERISSPPRAPSRPIWRMNAASANGSRAAIGGDLTGAIPIMPWNNGGPGPWGNPPAQAATAARLRRRPSGGSGRPTGRRRRWRRRRTDPARPRPGRPVRRPAAAPAAAAAAMPDLDQLIAQAQAFIRSLLRRRSGRGPAAGSRLRRRPRPGLAARPGGRRALGRQRLLSRAAGRAGRGAALRRLHLLDPARPALASALADRSTSSCRPSPASTAPRSATAPAAGGNDRSRQRCRRPRRAGRKPDADRRREHHRHRRRGVLADQRRAGLPVQHRQPGRPGARRWRKARCAR